MVSAEGDRIPEFFQFSREVLNSTGFPLGESRHRVGIAHPTTSQDDLIEAQPGQQSLSREVFDQQSQGKTNHRRPTIQAFSILIEAKFWVFQLRGNRRSDRLGFCHGESVNLQFLTIYHLLL